MSISYKVVFAFLIILGFPSVKFLNGQPGIYGYISLDTSYWEPVAYLSVIPDFTQLNKMSRAMIIDQAPVSPNGEFRFNTSYLPREDNLYRIHFVRKNDPVASLIIGGADENHVFLVSNSYSEIIIKDSEKTGSIKDVRITGYYPNDILNLVDEIYSYSDTTGSDSSPIKLDLIKSIVSEKLRFVADTCRNSVVSLYAIYKSDFENNYPENKQFYLDYLSKWKNEKSTYFEKFLKSIVLDNRFSVAALLKYATLFLLGVLTAVLGLKLFNKQKNMIHDLSLQERKIYALLLEGKSNKDISEELKIGLSTVKSHVNSIYSKLNIKSRKEALNLNLNITGEK